MRTIFIADFLPLANKGEEEIIRGIETLFAGKYHDKLEFRVFGNVETVTRIGNVIVYPKSICYPNPKVSGKKKVLAELLMAAKGLLGYYPYERAIKAFPGLMDDIRKCDFVLLGHDGFFNLECSLLGLFLKKNNIKYSILGAGFNKPAKKVAWIIDKVFKKCFDSAQYVILREKTAYNYVKSVSNNQLVSLLPDPAFFCPSDAYNKKRIASIIEKYRLDDNCIKVGVTICENSISFSTAFKEYDNKSNEHREFISNLLTLVHQKTNCRFYFLPHCIEEGAGNDLVIAHDIVSRIGDKVDCKIIEEDMPVLDIKYIISLMDMVIGERTHSIINSISTSTPFIVLTCSADFRTFDIVGHGCSMYDYIFNLDIPNLNEIEHKVLDIISNVKREEALLDNVCKGIEEKKNRFLQII